MRRAALLLCLSAVACRPSLEVDLGDAEWFALVGLDAADGDRVLEAGEMSLGPVRPVAAFPASIARSAETLVLLFGPGAITETVGDTALFAAGPCDPPVTPTGQLHLEGGAVAAPNPPFQLPRLSASWASASRCGEPRTYLDPNAMCRVGRAGQDPQACTIELAIDDCCARVSFAGRGTGTTCPGPAVGSFAEGVVTIGAQAASGCEGAAALGGLSDLELACSDETTCTAHFGSSSECPVDLGDCENPIGTCETDLRDTDAHCGACGMSCAADRFCGAARCLCVEEGRAGALTPLGTAPNGPSEAPSIGENGDGPVVAFASHAKNLVSGVGDGREPRVFVWTPAGLEVLRDLPADAPRVSPNGRYVVFESEDTDLTPTAEARNVGERVSGRIAALDVVDVAGAPVVAIAYGGRLQVRACRAACATLRGTETTTGAEDLRAHARPDGWVEVIVAGRDRIGVTECNEVQGCAPLRTLALGPFQPGLDLAEDGQDQVALARREGGLTLLRCSPDGCYAGADRQDLPFIQDGAALSFDAGRPVLAYVRDEKLGRLVCRDPACAGFDATIVADPVALARVVFGDARHLAYLGPGGIPHVVKCLDDTCATRVTRPTTLPESRRFDLTVREGVWTLAAETAKSGLWLEVGFDELGGTRHRSLLGSEASGIRLGRSDRAAPRVVLEARGQVGIIDCPDAWCEASPIPIPRRRIYLHDRSNGSTIRASSEPTGEDVTDDAHSAVVANDGRVVYVRDGKPFAQLFVFDPARHATRVLAGTLIGPIEAPAISADGGVVAFTTRAGLTLDAPPRERVLWLDLATDELGEVPTVGPSRRPSLSGDGRRVAFETEPDALPYPHHAELHPGDEALYGTRGRTGLAVYAPVRAGVLHVAVCSNADCPELERPTPVGAVAEGKVALAAGASRGPVLVYPAAVGGTRALIYRRCVDTSCGSLTVPQSLASGDALELVGAFVNNADQTRVFYLQGTDLREVICANEACTGSAPRTAMTGIQNAAVAQSGSSRAVLATTSDDSLTLRRLDSAGRWQSEFVSPDVVGEFRVEVGPDGRPVVLFGLSRTGGVELFAVRCVDLDCTSLSAAVSLGPFARSPKLALMVTSDDQLVVAAGDTLTGELSLIVCGDASCRDPERFAVDDRFFGGLSAFVGPDRAPWLSFGVQSGLFFRLACGSPSCDDPSSEPDRVAVTERGSGQVEVVSVRPGGGALVEPARWPRLAPSGRYLTFASADPGLGPAICGDASHVFRVDLDTGELLRMSVDSRGREGACDSLSADVTSSGAVVFESYAENFAAPGLLDRVLPQVYLRR